MTVFETSGRAGSDSDESNKHCKYQERSYKLWTGDPGSNFVS